MKITIQHFRSFDKNSSEVLDRLGLLLVRLAGFILLVELIYQRKSSVVYAPVS